MSEEVATPVVEESTPVLPAVTEAPEATPVAETPAPAESAASTEEEKSDTETPEKPKTTSRFERRISRLHREAAEQKARADFLEQQLKQFQPKPADAGGPRMDQFTDIEEYAKAYAEHEKHKALQDYQAKQVEAARKAQIDSLKASWEARVAAVKYDDFEEVVGDLAPDTPMKVAIMKADNGDEIAYHLAKNMKEAVRINNLDPVDQFLEIGRLSAQLKLQPPGPPKVSKAPAPITPVSGTRATVAKTSDEAASFKEFVKLRNRELGRV